MHFDTDDDDLGLASDRWIGVREAARLASVDPRTIRRWADLGQIRARRTPGGHRQVSVSGLRAAYQPASTAQPEPEDTPPDEAIPRWVATAVLWRGWSAPRRLNDEDLYSLSADLRVLRDVLADVEDAATAAFRRRSAEIDESDDSDY